MEQSIPRHIRLTSHPGMAGQGAIPLRWGASSPAERGPVVASPAPPRYRNAVGSYSGAYAVYRALAVATRALARDHRPDLTDTSPAALIAAQPQWADPAKIVSLDPWGHLVGEVFADHIRAGIDIRPTIAITRARIDMPELRPLLADGRLHPDGQVLLDNGEIRVTKAAIEPVWHLPGLAARFGVAEADLRRTLFEETGGMFPELVTRPDIEALLPPIGGMTVYLFGEVERITDPGRSSPAGFMTSATARTSSAPTSAPAAPIWCTASKSASRPRNRAGSASSSTTARRAGRSARSPNFSSTTPASAKWGATAPTPISSAPNALPACRTCAFRS